MMNNPLPSGIEAGYDGMVLVLIKFCRVAAAPLPGLRVAIPGLPPIVIIL